MEGLEGLQTVASLPYSTLVGPLQRVEGRLLAGWLHQRPLLLLLVDLHLTILSQDPTLDCLELT